MKNQVDFARLPRAQELFINQNNLFRDKKKKVVVRSRHFALFQSKGSVILKPCLRAENSDCVGLTCDVTDVSITLYSLCKCFKISLKCFGSHFKNAENPS